MERPLSEYRKRIEDALQQVLSERERQKDLYQPIQHMLSMGGKRFRPASLLIACEMFGGDPEEGVHAGSGIELFHNFTLMHDDLMDEAPLRRGNPTVYSRYGRDTAVLSGDAMFVKAYQEMTKVGEKVLKPVLEDFDRVALEVCEGQKLDMDFEEREDVSVEEYLAMIVSKTGALLGGALSIGARIGGASEEEISKMEIMGRDIGVAFQLQDDLLDVFGDEGKFGKRRGGDIIAQKKTHLLIRAREKSDAEQLERLRKAFEDVDEEERIRKVMKLYDELEVGKEARELSDSYFQKAWETLGSFDVEEEHKAPFRELLRTLWVRES